MTSSFPTPSSNIADFAAFRSREYTRTLVALRQAHDQHSDGPVVLALVNELACLAEEILVYRCDDDGLAQSACSPAAQRFLQRLGEACDRIARNNGEIDPAFFDLVETLPGDVARVAA